MKLGKQALTFYQSYKLKVSIKMRYFISAGCTALLIQVNTIISVSTLSHLHAKIHIIDSSVLKIQHHYRNHLKTINLEKGSESVVREITDATMPIGCPKFHTLSQTRINIY